MQRFSVLFEQDEDGIFIAHVPSLPGCHTQAKTLAEAERRVKEAIKLYLEVSRRKRAPIKQNQFVAAQLIKVS
jgi:predicted RNase H-like HicB family nuclease